MRRHAIRTTASQANRATADPACDGARGSTTSSRRIGNACAQIKAGYPPRVTVLNPTPAARLVDQQGRPYFLWDTDLTLARFTELLRTGDLETRAWLVGKLMRQAKPDDVFGFVSLDEIRALWSDLDRHLGRSRPMWQWLMNVWATPQP